MDKNTVSSIINFVSKILEEEEKDIKQRGSSCRTPETK